MTKDRVVTDYIRKRLSIQKEENWSQDRTLEDPQVRSEGEDVISFMLQLVSYLAGKNGGRTEQDHKYRKRFRGEFGECYNRLHRKQRLDPEESEQR